MPWRTGAFERTSPFGSCTLKPVIGNWYVRFLADRVTGTGRFRVYPGGRSTANQFDRNFSALRSSRRRAAADPQRPFVVKCVRPAS